MARMTNAEYQANLCERLGFTEKEREKVMKRVLWYIRLIDKASAKGDMKSVSHIWQVMEAEADRDVHLAMLIVDIPNHPQYWVKIRFRKNKTNGKNKSTIKIIDETYEIEEKYGTHEFYEARREVESIVKETLG